MSQRKKAEEGGVGDPARPRSTYVVLSLSMLIVATVAFLAYAAFFPDGNAGGLYQYWWRCQLGQSGRLGTVPAAHDKAAAASGVRAPTTLSHIVFGIGSSARRWDTGRGYSELWWRAGEMRGHVWLDAEPATKPPPNATCPPYRVSADASRFVDRASASRMARIVADSFLAVTAELGGNGTAREEEEEVRWFVMGDDDTVFFPDNLVAVLRKYDHQEMYYVGAPSESVEQDQMHLYGTAFGGGGFAVSYPAAAELAEAIDGCLDRYQTLYGSDERVHACLSELGIPLTREPGFHQMDVRGDAYGMLAAHPVAPLVSLHHLDHIRPIYPQSKTALDAVRLLVGASQVDPARTLQQSICYQHGPGYNWSVSIAWGYTAQVYPWSVPARKLELPLQTFSTWQTGANGPFLFNTRPFIPDNNTCASPAVFFLTNVLHETGGATVTEYSRHQLVQTSGTEGCDDSSFRAASAIRTVRVLAPKMSPGEWERAPRRHCCSMEKTVEGSVLEVQIRRCGKGELATAP